MSNTGSQAGRKYVLIYYEPRHPEGAVPYNHPHKTLHSDLSAAWHKTNRTNTTKALLKVKRSSYAERKLTAPAYVLANYAASNYITSSISVADIQAADAVTLTKIVRVLASVVEAQSKLMDSSVARVDCLTETVDPYIKA